MRIAAALTTACYCLQVCVSVLLAVRQVAANDENCTEFMDTGGVLACLQILGWVGVLGRAPGGEGGSWTQAASWHAWRYWVDGVLGRAPWGGGVMDTGRVLACMQILGGRGR